MASHESRVGELLLSESLAYAVENVPAYDHLKGSINAIKRIDQLSSLPILRKAQIRECPDRYLAQNRETHFLQHTGGTSKFHLMIHRCNEEVQFRSEFAARRASAQNVTEGHAIHIQLNSPRDHGTPIDVNRHSSYFRLELEDWLWRERIDDIVSRPWYYACCKPAKAVITGLEPHLRLLTGLLIEAGYDFRRSAVTGLVSYGDLVTTGRSQWYEQIWGATLFDRFSISEAWAAADRCPACKRFHFEPTVQVEAVDVQSCLPVQRGIGVLILTTLYPFVQRQPLIRYWTGDLIEVEQCETGGLGFTFLGRLEDCIVDMDRGCRLLLSSARLCNLLEQIPDIAYSVDTRTGLNDPTITGNPICRINASFESQRRICVFFRPAYNAALFPDHDSNVAAKLKRGLLSEHPDLADAVTSGRVELTVASSTLSLQEPFRPGSIMPWDDFKEGGA